MDHNQTIWVWRIAGSQTLTHQSGPALKKGMGAAFILMLALAVLFSGCSFFQSEEKKAEGFYEEGLKAVKADDLDAAIIHFKNAIQKNPEFAKAHLELAKIFLRKKELNQAVRELNLAIRQDDKLLEAKKALALLFFENRGYTKAISLYREILEQVPDDLDTNLLLGNALINDNNPGEAVKVLEKVLEKNPNNPTIQASLSRAYLAAGNTADARKYMESAAGSAPDDLSVQVLLAQFYENQGLNDLAEESLARIREKFPDKPAPYLASAQLLLRRNRADSAQAVLEQGLAAGVKDPNLLQGLALVFHRQKKYEKALESFKNAYELDTNSQKSAILLADYHIYLKQYDKARLLFEKISEKWPELIPVKSKIAELLMAEGNRDAAMAEIEKLLAEHPDFSKAYILKGTILMRKGEDDEARKSFAKAREVDPGAADGNYYYGLSFLDDKKYDLALSELTKAVEKAPGNTKYRLTLAFTYYQTRNPSAALEELNRIMSVEPENRKARALRAEVYYESGELEKAVEEYEYLLEKQPDSPMDRFRLGEIRQRLGQLDEALAAFEAVQNSYPDPIKPLAKIILINVEKKNFDNSLKLCDDWLEKNPGNLEIGLIKAAVLTKSNRFNQALSLLTEITQKHPESPQPYNLMAQVRLLQNRNSDALAFYERAIEKDPANIEARMKSAGIYGRDQNYPAAIASLEALLKEKPDYAPAANDLAYLLAVEKKDLDRALELATSAAGALPNIPDTADTLGYVYLQKGADLVAIQHFQKALSMAPDKATYQYHLGLALYRQNRREEARQQLSAAVKGDLEKEQEAKAKEILAQLEKGGASSSGGEEAGSAISSDTETALALIQQGRDTDATTLLENRLAQEPNDISAAVVLARIFADADQNLDRAFELAQKAVRERPENSDASDVLGWVYLKRDSLLLAKKHLYAALDRQPKNPLYLFHLGMVFFEEKDFDEARRLLNEAVEKGLSPHEAQMAKTTLDSM